MEEEVLPPETRAAGGFEPPRVRQFTVFVENRVGRLQTLVRCLEQENNAIRALSAEESADATLVRLICSDSDLARETLRKNEFSFGETEMIAVEFPKRTVQPLTTICSALLAAEINIRSVYPFLVRPRLPALVLYVDDPVLAAQLLIKKGFVLIAESDFKK
ncbi:MAG: acetolactate synthase [Tepidisphaeraceae bacterium]|jgi:hypothetical protein